MPHPEPLLAVALFGMAVTFLCGLGLGWQFKREHAARMFREVAKPKAKP